MKKTLLKVLPFVVVPVIMLGSVWLARIIHSPAKDVYHVNTSPTADGAIHSIRIFDSITSVMVIDRDKHFRKKKLKSQDYSYNRFNGELILTSPLPFADNVIHIEGVTALPEQFRLHDFDGAAEDLLVLLDDHEAANDYEYSFDPDNRILTFREDIHPEKNGTFLIMYQTQDGATHSFGNWLPGTNDRFAELQWQWLHRTQDAPMMVMLDRSRLSNRRLSREVGFDIRLPKGDATFICQTLNGTHKKQTVMRWYGDIIAECQAEPFIDYDGLQSADEMRVLNIGKMPVTRQEIVGTRQNTDGSTEPIPMVIYCRETRGTYYRISCEVGLADAAEKVIQ
ncbi:MAG: hypothetical protein IKQ61_08290 [Spirochaetales bacterium]|nr:hypothetical protein [Spirochaetales bacterium]